MKRKLANFTVKVASKKPFKNWLFRAGRNQSIIFMLHRFDLSPYGAEGGRGHDIQFLERCLIDLKSSGYNLVSVDELLEAHAQGRTIDNAVAFTIDDGFYDHGIVAEKVFAKHSVPVTIYLVTDFVDGEFWMIESRIEYLLRAVCLTEFSVMIAGKRFSANSLRGLERELIWYTKALTLQNAEKFIDALSAALSISVPIDPPDEFKPISWEEARRLEALGIRFGAHTSQHASLSSESDEESKRQIEKSRSRMFEELKYPSNIFCYPTGRAKDFGAREQVYVKDSGFIGALSTIPGYFNQNTDWLADKKVFQLPRFSWPTNFTDLRQYSLYIENLKERVHGS
jgi:peptidoglycan/xylan/chitin deacetylase (PgdA/CDA1 family)